VNRREFRLHDFGADGFTLLETLVALVIFSVGLMAVSSISISMVSGNRVARHYLEASVLAQSQAEILRNTGWNYGPDGIPFTADDVVPQILTDINTGNNALVSPATMFANPDHAYTATATGAETNPVLDSTALTTTKYLRRAWIVRDNVAGFVGLKFVTVVVGWKEGSLNSYSVVSTVIQGH